MTEDDLWQVPTQRFLNSHKLVWIVNNDVNICRVGTVSWCSGLAKVPIYQPTGKSLQSWLQSDVQPSTICSGLGNSLHSVLKRERCHHIGLKHIHFYLSHSWHIQSCISHSIWWPLETLSGKGIKKITFSFSSLILISLPLVLHQENWCSLV